MFHLQHSLKICPHTRLKHSYRMWQKKSNSNLYCKGYLNFPRYCTDHSGAQSFHTDQHKNLVGGNHSHFSGWNQSPLPSKIGATGRTLRNHLGRHIRLQSTISHRDLPVLPAISRINCNIVQWYLWQFS